MKGIKASGKVYYFTATAPYLFMLILLVRGALLPGAVDGVLYYLVPSFDKLLNIEVWVDAGTQVFYSYSIGIGGLITLGSYNKWNHNSYRDSLVFAVANSGTSLFAGFVVFTMLGFMAHEQGTTVDHVAESGPGLAFIAYPKAVSQMPFSPFWSLCFFFMLILMGLDCQFVGVEALVTGIVDLWPKMIKGYRRALLIAIICVLQCILGFSHTTQGGMYVFQLFDFYACSRLRVLVLFFECITIAYLYGANRYLDNLEVMYGFRVNLWMKICWLVLSPLYCLLLFVMSMVDYSELTYSRPLMTYEYPLWAVTVGWVLAGLSILLIPLTAIVLLVKYTLQGKPLRSLIQPQGLQEHQMKVKTAQMAEMNGVSFNDPKAAPLL